MEFDFLNKSYCLYHIIYFSLKSRETKQSGTQQVKCSVGLLLISLALKCLHGFDVCESTIVSLYLCVHTQDSNHYFHCVTENLRPIGFSDFWLQEITHTNKFFPNKGNNDNADEWLTHLTTNQLLYHI